MSTKLIISSLAGVSIMGGAGAGAYYFFNKKTEEKSLEQLLISENKIPLKTSDATDNESWGKLIDKFLSTDNSVTVKKIENTNIVKAAVGATDNKAQNIEKLKSTCKALLEKTKDYSNDKEVAINWCTKASPLLK